MFLLSFFATVHFFLILDVRLHGYFYDPWLASSKECRPDQVLLFNANNHDSSARIDVLPDGRVNWVAGGHSYGWVSLSNLVFVPGATIKIGSRSRNLDCFMHSANQV